MTALLFITVLCTVLALLARRFVWACTAGMAAGGVLVLAALVCSIPTQTLLLCLLIPCTAALCRKGEADEFYCTRLCAGSAAGGTAAPPFAAPRTLGTAACSQPWVLCAWQSEGPAAAGVHYAGTYAAALAIGRCKSRVGKRLWLCCAAILCLGCLGVFKYAGLFGTGASLLLPAGISFYTFQTLGYVIDVYRGRLAPERHPGYYALFVSFFPQLVAGPIERSTDLLPQLRDPARRTDSGGWLYILRGFCKKLLLADTAAVFIDTVYAAPGAASGPAAILATVLFAGQIYWDFSGYSDIAVGAAALLGVRLSRNFDHPYQAVSLCDFWHRCISA